MRIWCEEGDRLAAGEKQSDCGVGGVQVVVKHPARGSAAFGLGIHRGGLLGGVGAQQIVEGEPARRVLGQQVNTGEFGQCLAGLY